MRSKKHRNSYNMLIIIVLSMLCANCTNRLISPLDILPGSEYHIGEYPNVHVHPSSPAKQPLSVQELDNVKQKLKNIR